MSTLKFEVPLFDGKSNFTLWQSTIQDYLVQQGLDFALEGTKPDEMKDNDWKAVQRKAVSTIRLALAPQIKYTVLKETSPKVLWDKLESMFASKSMASRLCMKLDLYSLRMDEGGNIHDHINIFNQLACQLLNTGEKIEDEEQALLLLASLSRSYKPLVQSMLIGKKTLTLNEVITVLKENDKIMRNGDNPGESQLLAVESSERGRSQKKKVDRRDRSKSRQRDMSNVECYYCGANGHIQKSCPKFKEDLKGLKQLQEKMKVSDSSVNVVNESGDFLLHTTDDGSGKNYSGWVLDSASDFHICRDRAMFDTLHTDGDFGYINVGNKLKQKIEGVGRIRLKLHNGIVKNIPNVKYVSTAGANIISLGEMASHGYKYVGIGNQCKVYRGGSLIMQGRKKGKNIYYLDDHSLKSQKAEKSQKTEKRVHFSDTVEVYGNLGRGRICCVGSPNPTSGEGTKNGRLGSYKKGLPP